MTVSHHFHGWVHIKLQWQLLWSFECRNCFVLGKKKRVKPELRLKNVDLKLYQRQRRAHGKSLAEPEKINLLESSPYYCFTDSGSPSGRDLLHNYQRRYSDSVQNKGPQMESEQQLNSVNRSCFWKHRYTQGFLKASILLLTCCIKAIAWLMASLLLFEIGLFVFSVYILAISGLAAAQQSYIIFFETSYK